MAQDFDPSPSKETGSARVYAKLRHDILTVAIAPGTALDEIGLSERFALSRSPIREALVRLSSEGLVQILPNRSTLVAPIDIKTLPQFLDALDLYQRATTRAAAVLRTEEDLREIVDFQDKYVEGARRSLEAGNSVFMIDSNYEFHMSVARAGKNRYLSQFYSRILNEGRRMLHFHFEFQRQDPDINAEKLGAGHVDMIEAIRARDSVAAERVAHEHAMQFRGRFLNYLNSNLQFPA